MWVILYYFGYLHSLLPHFLYLNLYQVGAFPGTSLPLRSHSSHTAPFLHCMESIPLAHPKEVPPIPSMFPAFLLCTSRYNCLGSQSSPATQQSLEHNLLDNKLHSREKSMGSNFELSALIWIYSDGPQFGSRCTKGWHD